MRQRRARASARLIFDPDTSGSWKLARLSVHARAIWFPLLVAADDQGRMAGDLASVKESAIPLWSDFDQSVVESALSELAGENFIRRYECDGVTLLQVESWWKYQGGLPIKRPSEYPAPDRWTDRVTALDESQGHVKQIRPGAALTCPVCGYYDRPERQGRGFLCRGCGVELLGRKYPKPMLGANIRRRQPIVGTIRDAILATLGRDPQSWWTRHELSELIPGYNPRSIANELTQLERAGRIEVEAGRGSRPSRYRFKP